jgi:hypothetical protein
MSIEQSPIVKPTYKQNSQPVVPVEELQTQIDKRKNILNT